jgi:hypothetical protein
MPSATPVERVEALVCLQEIADDQEAPALADGLERARERTEMPVPMLRLHAPRIEVVDGQSSAAFEPGWPRAGW